jgi:dipeptide/tripeptide permease
MSLIIYYVVLVAVGTIASILVGLWTDQMSSNMGMSVFLCLYFITLWLAWIIAVRITAPKKLAPEAKVAVEPSRA